MRFILLCLMVGILLPRVVSSSDYCFIKNNMRTVEIKDGISTVTERSDRFKKLYFFIASHPAEKNPLETTELVYNCPYPEIMAAIPSVESGFDPNAIGADGEKSAWQILDWPGGDPTNTAHALNEAIKVFEEKKVGRSYEQAIKAYNGTGSKAERYKRLVLAKIQIIKNLKI